ncbi:unnamed protein product [Meganyctiphanes norvegica]|uniref:TIR domain-containing protein n=1 Tax=Meganyctiphanes norvegica TaxID=48144 RepID=A0AAV2Q067_MEGNR
MELQLLLLLTTVSAALGQLEQYLSCGQGKCDRSYDSLTCPQSMGYEFELSVARTGIKIQCRTNISHIDTSYLEGCNFPNVTALWFEYCPMPNVSFTRFLNEVGINSSNVTHFRFHNYGVRGEQVLRDDHFEGFQNLEYVDMTGNYFTDIPDSLFKETSELHTLNLIDNNVTTLSESLFSNTPKVKMLTLEGNNLFNLPVNVFSNLKELTNISLYNNALSDIHPEIFSDLYNLLLIELADNNFSELPSDLFINNTKLRTVSLRKNKLETLPESLFTANNELVQIKLSKNNLQTLPENIFKESKNVVLLNMGRNKISSLPPKIFQNMVELRNLSIEYNQLESFPENLFSGLSNVLQIDLKNNLLISLHQQAFQSTQNLIDLHLTGNRLTELPERIFEKCTSLSELHISYNNLTSLPYSLFPKDSKSKLRLVDLSYNNLSSLCHLTDDICVVPATPFNDQFNLELVNLAANKLSYIPHDFQNILVNLKKLSFRGNMIKIIDNLDFQSKHVVIDLRNNYIERYLINLDIMPFLGKKKLEIYLSGNNIICDCFSYGLLRIIKNETILPFSIKILDIKDVQCSGPESHKNQDFLRLNSLDLTCKLEEYHSDDEQGCTHPCQCSIRFHDKQHIMNCSNSGLSDVPVVPESFINKSLTLNLDKNSITSLISLQKPEYKNVTELNVATNKLDYIDIPFLPKNLKMLDIRNNQINNISQAVADRWNNTNITVSLSDNPWVCDCSLQPLYNFILDHNHDKVLDVGSVYCAVAPEVEKDGEMEPVKILDMRTDQFCPYALPLEVMVTLSVVIVLTVTFSVIGTVVYYRNNEAIKVWLFSHHLCLCWVTEEELDADKKYDAFISYSHKDEEFVNQLLVPGLESGDPVYRICLHYRDWVPGEYIQNQILSSVKASRRTVVVLSKNFIESVWGQMEFKAAHSQALQDNTNRIIVIVYGEIPPESSMDEELKLYIATKTYLKWGDTKFWERLRYAMPHPQYPINNNKRKRLNTDKIELCKANSDKTV